MLNQEIVREATRLTRAGRLIDATPLLQHMLCGESLPEPSVRTTGGAPERLDPPTIDVKATVLEKKEGHPPASDPPSRIGLAPFDSIKDFSGLGLRGPIRRALPSTADIAPDGTRFIERTFIPREAGTTNCSSQAVIRDDRFRWS